MTGLTAALGSAVAAAVCVALVLAVPSLIGRHRAITRASRRPVRVAPPAAGRVVAAAGTGTLCRGCRIRTAVAVLTIRGYIIPVCPTCRDLALSRIAAGHLTRYPTRRTPGGPQ